MRTLPSTAQPSTLSLPTNPAGFVKFVSGVDDFLGDMMKISGKDGKSTAGSQGLEIKLPRSFAVLVGLCQAGFIDWKNGTAARQGWLRLSDDDADLDTLRTSLGDIDPATWAKGADGAVDPFKLSIKLPLADLETGALYTYCSSANSHVKAVRRFVRSVLVLHRTSPAVAGLIPVATISVASVKTQNGTLFYPEFTTEDWITEQVVLDALGKSGRAAQLQLGCLPARSETEIALNDSIGF
jgi:hypothetical protein